MTIMKKMAVAAIAALTITGSSVAASTAANARQLGGFRGGHHGFHGGFRGPRFGIGAGIATGLALGGLGYYGYNSYGGCYLERRVFINRWGHRFVRPVRVCV